jgi:uncharacterized protein (DUF2126 family)
VHKGLHHQAQRPGLAGAVARRRGNHWYGAVYRAAGRQTVCVSAAPATTGRLPGLARCAIELTAAELQVPVCIEGYPPPSDPRLDKFMITPDPGVIEVNVMPAASWADLVKNTRSPLRGSAAGPPGHREIHARRASYGYRRRQPCHPGRAHAIGVAVSCAAPICLASMITFWQHHPSLSYLFLRHVHRPNQPGAPRGRGAT